MAIWLSRKEIDKLVGGGQDLRGRGPCHHPLDRRSSSLPALKSSSPRRRIRALYAATDFAEGDVLLLAADANSESLHHSGCGASGCGGKYELIDKANSALWVTGTTCSSTAGRGAAYMAKAPSFTMPRTRIWTGEATPAPARAKAYDWCSTAVRWAAFHPTSTPALQDGCSRAGLY